MNHDEIIRMAREATNNEPLYGRKEFTFSQNELERFAALVASAEREAIAKLFDNPPTLVKFAQNDLGGCMVCGFTPKMAIAAIRERGETK